MSGPLWPSRRPTRRAGFTLWCPGWRCTRFWRGWWGPSGAADRESAWPVRVQRRTWCCPGNGRELVTGDDRFFRAVSGQFPPVRRVEGLASRIW